MTVSALIIYRRYTNRPASLGSWAPPLEREVRADIVLGALQVGYPSFCIWLDHHRVLAALGLPGPLAIVTHAHVSETAPVERELAKELSGFTYGSGSMAV